MSVAPAPGDVTAPWLTDALTRAGMLDGQTVIDVRYSGVGHGMMSDSFRFHIAYSGGDDLPATLIGKFAAVDPTSRRTASDYALYQTEVDFYREVAPHIAARVPEVLVAAFDLETHFFTLLMRDLAPARTVDQMAGCAIEDIETALCAAAGFHGSCWGRRDLEAQPWVARRRRLNEALIAEIPRIGAAFLSRYDAMLEADCKRAVRRLIEIYPRILRDRSSPQTLQHGDYRLDNLLFDVGGRFGAHVLDWANIAWASGLIDIAYFIGASLGPAERALHERNLVRSYYGALRRFPIGDYGWEACWADYRRFGFLGLFTGVMAPMMVERSERSDRLFLGMVRNHVDQIETLDAFSFWA